MDLKKLEDLRRRYADQSGGDMYDPHFAAVARGVFNGQKRKWPFAGVPTLITAPYRPELNEATEFGDLDVALVGVPMDLGVTNRNGSRFGPRAVRHFERIGPYEHVLKIAPLTQAKVADIGDIALTSRYDLARCHADIEAYFSRFVGTKVIPLAVGGDHSISLPILKALGRQRPVGMIHIDAHCDTSGAFEGTKFHHGGPFRQAVLEGVLDPERTIQIGIRGPSEYLWEFSYESGMRVIHAEDIDKMGMDAVIAEMRRVVGDGPTYVSFDVDAIDPAYAPGTGTPEVGGLTPREMLDLMRGAAGINMIGGDVVEVAPQYDATSSTAHIGAQALFQLACLAAITKGATPGG